MPLPDLVLLAANVVYATSYVATRVALEEMPPASLALFRLVLGSLALAALARRRMGAARMPAAAPGDGLRLFAMGALGFAGAFAFTHWGIARSTATNAALLVVVEPVSIVLLGPLLLGERLSRREWAGAAVAVSGAAVVVVNGVPGMTAAIAPHWRGDLLLVVAGLCYAAYSLIGRPLLARAAAPLAVTVRSIAWGALVMAPLAAAEWRDGRWPAASGTGLAAALYLALVITALGYFAWNWALVRVPAARAAIFLNVQPVVGALLGVLLLGETLTPFTAAGGVLVVGGLWLTVRRRD